MTKEEFEDLKVGDFIYYYHHSIGMLEYEIDGIAPNGSIRTKEKGTFNKSNLLENYSISEDKSHLHYYIVMSNHNMGKLESLKNSIKKIEQEQKKLDGQFGYLRDKFSEEFI